MCTVQDADLAEQRGTSANGEGRLSITNNIGRKSLPPNPIMLIRNEIFQFFPGGKQPMNDIKEYSR